MRLLDRRITQLRRELAWKLNLNGSEVFKYIFVIMIIHIASLYNIVEISYQTS